MKQDFAFVAERPLARHSPALLRAGPDEAELITALGRVAARMARSLRGSLARLCGGNMPDVAIDPPLALNFADFAREGICAYSLYGVNAAPGTAGIGHVIGAIDAEAVLRLVDRAFGGPGDAPRPILREMPLSADLMVQRIDAIMATQLGLALGGVWAAQPLIQPLRRDYDLAQIAPFTPATRLVMLNIAVSEGTRAPWPIRLALPLALLPVLTGIAAPAPVGTGDGPANSPDDEPFAAMPLTLTALLVDTPMSLQVVSRLEPGQVLNLPIARSVPLIIGQPGAGADHGGGHGSAAVTVAQGTIGAVDDRVAIQITQLA
ncbi:flagellar switch protein [Novosphingobium sp.]|uniref:flagellar switch protein n=1 Tax=Novosphingobium sp. TaxID=1874826 RepID=UPI0033404336